MNFACSKSSIKRIGEKLRHSIPLDDSEENAFAMYRNGHRNIIEAFRHKHKQLTALDRWKDGKIVFASRLKKRATISAKLASRQCKMDLTRMNDIAGCRLIFPDVKMLDAYRELFLEQCEKLDHYVLRTKKSQYDYIRLPRETGYRGIHDVYEECCQDAIRAKIEVQYRTAVQHSWATALEIWDYSHCNGVKFGLECREVQDIFMYISELFWRYLDSNADDKRIDVSSRVLYKKIVELDKKVRLIDFFALNKRIKVSPRFIKVSRNKDGILLSRGFVNVGISGANIVKVIPNMWDNLMEELFDEERKDVRDSVLISMDGEYVRDAYNNYFDDARKFKQNLRKSLMMAYEDINAFKRHFVPDVEPLVEELQIEK